MRSNIPADMEKQRSMDVQYFQTSACAREIDEGNCALQPLLDRLKLTTDSFIALALSVIESPS